MHANQQRALNSIIGGTVGSDQVRTLAHRLESAASTINYQSNRIEDVLAKINGTPRAAQAQGIAEKGIAVTAPLSQSVEMVEQLAERLCSLAANLEQVA